ncbi:MAG: trigger factor [Gammaproteobacteria bacterium]|nr:trigger factor [Gammaproteobacteria bacterium]
MQVSLDNTGALERRLTIQVPEDRIAGEVHTRLKSLAQSTRIAGFRPGRAPLRVVEKRFGARVRQEVVGDVLRSTFREAVVKENLRPAGDPTIEPLTAEPGAGLSYTATFEVYPEVDLARLETVDIERPVCTVGESEIDAMTEKLRSQARTWSDVQRAAASGDRVTIDYRGLIDGEAFEGGSQDGAAIEIGAGRLIPGFEDGLIGALSGEHRQLALRFPDDFPRQELAGKDVHFEVDVKAVAAPVLPDLDETFFKQFGVTEGGLAAFRAEVRRNMQRELEQALRQKLRNNIMTALCNAYDIDIPRALVANESQRLLNDLRQRFAYQGASREQLDALDPALVAGEARRRVTLGLIIAEVVRANELRADPQQVRARVEAAAATYEDPAAVIKWYYEDRSRLGDVEAAVLEDESVEWVLARAKGREQPVAFDALMNPRQTGDGAQAEA